MMSHGNNDNDDKNTRRVGSHLLWKCQKRLRWKSHWVGCSQRFPGSICLVQAIHHNSLDPVKCFEGNTKKKKKKKWTHTVPTYNLRLRDFLQLQSSILGQSSGPYSTFMVMRQGQGGRNNLMATYGNPPFFCIFSVRSCTPGLGGSWRLQSPHKWAGRQRYSYCASPVREYASKLHRARHGSILRQQSGEVTMRNEYWVTAGYLWIHLIPTFIDTESVENEWRGNFTSAMIGVAETVYIVQVKWGCSSHVDRWPVPS